MVNLTPMNRTLTVTSPVFANGGTIPAKYCTLENISPPINWTGVPSGTKALALVMEDADSPPPEPAVYWLIYNIPPTMNGLPEGVPAEKKLKDKSGIIQGRTSRKVIGYEHPDARAGGKLHHYHFELFAIDEEFPPESSMRRSAVMTNLSGHVLALGELIGTHKR
jgi:Raf kinase inhibitor-like YbhB/YbcL family protein